VNSLNVPLMFSQVPHPLHYAEALLQRFAALARLSNRAALLDALAESSAQLSDCELSQLYLLDATHTRLTLSADWHNCALHPKTDASLPSDYNDEQLLQFCLCQNQVLCLNELNSSLYSINFLPAAKTPWHSLLCMPLQDEQQHVTGLLLIASQSPRELRGFADSLTQLGNFAIAQLHHLQRQHSGPAATIEPARSQSKAGSGYDMIGDSAPMRALHQMISKVLHIPVSVLLNGETGTGKELVARAIHEYGMRRSKPLVIQNCASLPENLLESELFGYRKGAFSGADRDHQGLFDAANGGTLFLDEIGDMPLTLQAKLLRVLQEGEIRPLGSNTTHKVDVRIIAATHHNLRERVEQGVFREDLYYRLAQFPIQLPPLRERGPDILTLARYFADKTCELLQHQRCDWAEATLQALSAYDFPGNVRELKGLVERAVLLCEDGELLPEHFNLSQNLESTSNNMTLRERLERVERNMLIECLRKNGGNQTFAANELGLPRRTLLYRMQRLNINLLDV
jgi:sigma-54-dependent transcriptional regulator